MSSTKTPAPSEDRSRLQEEALAKNAETFRCVKQLQALTALEIGRVTYALNTAMGYVFDTAIALVEERCNGDENAMRATLKKFGYPDLMNW